MKNKGLLVILFIAILAMILMMSACGSDGSGEGGVILGLPAPHPLPEMVFVDGFVFVMGNTRDDLEGYSDEKPVHIVKMSYNYEIGKYELTNAQFLEFLNDAGVNENGQLNGHEVIDTNDSHCEFTYTSGKFSLKQEGKANYPVIKISWWGAMEYCNWLSEKAGLAKAYDNNGNLLDTAENETGDITQVTGYRLPTEAEWEYAARGGHADIQSGTEFHDYKYAGSNTIDEVAWYWENAQNPTYPIYDGKGTHEVGKKSPNELGIYDMSGNVWEWCHDWHGSYSITTQTNPVGPESSPGRVIRGGSWSYYTVSNRVANRGRIFPFDNGTYLGLRVSRTRE